MIRGWAPPSARLPVVAAVCAAVSGGIAATQADWLWAAIMAVVALLAVNEALEARRLRSRLVDLARERPDKEAQ